LLEILQVPPARAAHEGPRKDLAAIHGLRVLRRPIN